MICVRENSEGEYCGIGGRLHARHAGRARRADRRLHAARHRAHRALRVQARASRGRGRCWPAPRSRTRCSTRWCSGTRSSADVAKEFPDVELRKYHVDALCARMVTHPQTLDVIVASNLFGDILTDIGSAISGSLGVAPGGNINPERTTPSMFEPIHGSAPDIAGQGHRQPDRRHLGRRDDARPPRRARRPRARSCGRSRRSSPTSACKTPDLGGKATTADMTRGRHGGADRKERGRRTRETAPAVRGVPDHGGKPTASLTAAYSGCTAPSAARITSGGSTHVRLAHRLRQVRCAHHREQA